ncbi:MAG TPA: tetratricopeptide repeat protein [Bacteroidia bacterium]|nr:tetratricopeptide repeat protein [Bacteroidia bacterium]
MRILTSLLLFFVLAGSCVKVQAQPAGQSATELAIQYMNTGEWDKAIVYFEKYYNQDPYGAFPNYLKCFTMLKDYEGAEKLIKKHQKKFPGDPSIRIELGTLYETMGDAEKGKKVYSDVVKSLKPDINQINITGSAFMNRQMFSYAEETYVEGRKLLKGAYSFSFELAEAYAQDGKYPEMVSEYIDAMEYNAAMLPNIQTVLQNKIGNDLSGNMSDLIRQALLRKIQKNPNVSVYSELLYWLFLQEKDFESAYIQAKSLDKRLGESGDRLISLGRLCVSNGEYETAVNCFQTVIDKGTDNSNYITAKIELINSVNYKITNKGGYTQADLQKLDQDYASAIGELGKNASTASLLRGRAHLKAFYLHQTQDAIDLLNETIELPNLRTAFIAECKLELADVYVFDGQVWDAALLYGQVDKDFKNDAIGREAKFRNARLSYYMGEFDWAKDQLKVLKAATSQLISNDALSLGLLISDNTNMDTTSDALLMYSRADLLDFQNKDSLSLVTLDSLLKIFPEHSLTDEVWFKKAMIYKNEGKFAEAAKYLQDITDKYPDDILGDDAMYQLACLNEDQLNDKEKAKTLFETFLTKYPGSLFVVDARKHFRALRGDKL